MIRKLTFLTVALVLCFSPVGTFAQDDPPGVILPELTGPFQVGQAEYHLIDNSREEIFTEETGDVREILLTVYYPAEPAPDAQPALFFANDAVRAYFASAYVPGVIDDIYSHSYLNAPITGSNYPVLIFSPGLGATPLAYTTKLEGLASHGYIIIGIWYPYSAPIVAFPDGRLAEGNSAGQGTDMAGFREITEVWCDDTAFVIDQLEVLNQDDSLLVSAMDLSRNGYSVTQPVVPPQSICFNGMRTSSRVPRWITPPLMILTIMNCTNQRFSGYLTIVSSQNTSFANG